MALILITQVIRQVNYLDVVVFHPLPKSVDYFPVLCGEPTKSEWLDILFNDSIEVDHTQGVEKLSLNVHCIYCYLNVELLQLFYIFEHIIIMIVHLLQITMRRLCQGEDSVSTETTQPVVDEHYSSRSELLNESNDILHHVRMILREVRPIPDHSHDCWELFCLVVIYRIHKQLMEPIL